MTKPITTAELVSILLNMADQFQALFDTLVVAKKNPEAAHSIATVCVAQARQIDSAIANLVARLKEDRTDGAGDGAAGEAQP